jgi:hypothetical protein
MIKEVEFDGLYKRYATKNLLSEITFAGIILSGIFKQVLLIYLL